MAERRVAWVGRVYERIPLVVRPTGIDADHLRTHGGRDLQLCLERDLEAGGRDRGVRLGVEEHGSVAIAGEEHGPAPSILSEKAGERDAQLLMSSECQGGVAAERDQQVEGVARDDQGAGAFRTLEGAGEHQRG